MGLSGTELNHIGHDPHCRVRRTNPLFLSNVFFEHVVLNRAADLFQRNSPFLGHRKIHGEDNACGAVHRHRGCDFVERNVGKQPLHIFESRNRHAFAADFAKRTFTIGVVAHQHRHIERGGQTRLPFSQEELKALVGIFRRTETQQIAAWSTACRDTCWGRPHECRDTHLAGRYPGIVPTILILGGVNRLNLHVGKRRKAVRPLFRFGIFLRQPFVFGHGFLLSVVPPRFCFSRGNMSTASSQCTFRKRFRKQAGLSEFLPCFMIPVPQAWFDVLFRRHKEKKKNIYKADAYAVTTGYIVYDCRAAYTARRWADARKTLGFAVQVEWAESPRRGTDRALAAMQVSILRPEMGLDRLGIWVST